MELTTNAPGQFGFAWYCTMLLYFLFSCENAKKKLQWTWYLLEKVAFEGCFFFYFCFFMLLFPLFILLWSILSCCSVLRLYRTLINIQKLSEKSEITTYLCEKQHETLCCRFLSNSTSHLPWMWCRDAQLTYAHNITKFAVLSSKSTVKNTNGDDFFTGFQIFRICHSWMSLSILTPETCPGTSISSLSRLHFQLSFESEGHTWF